MSLLTRSHVLTVALVAAALGVGVTVVIAFVDPTRAVLGWLAAFGFGLGTALGALVLAMVFHVTNAKWPSVLRPQLMAVAGALPVFALLFLPIALGLRAAYPWAQLAGGHEPEVELALAHQRLWQHPSFFLARAVVYLAAWSVLAILLARADATHAREPTEANALRQRRISGAGLPILALTMTFASFDWFMSVEPGWISNMYGLYFFVGGLASAISVVSILVWRASSSAVEAPAAGPDHFHALGRLMLMGTILWAYIAFFQLLLVWIANLPREVGFYVLRTEHGFAIVSGILLFGHFILPFLTLLTRSLKRRGEVLAVVGAWLVLMDAIDLAWLILPRAGGGLHVLDVAPFLAVAGLAVAFGAWRAGRQPLLVDPRSVVESLRYRSS